MHTVLIANPKGGSGKTTLATNLAGYFATRGRRVTLCDLDKQQSALDWLDRRPQELPMINGINGQREKIYPKNIEWLVIDSPAGLHGEKLENAVKNADMLLVPVLPSAFDIDATRHFLTQVQEIKSIRKGNTMIGMVGMRTDIRTKAYKTLLDFLAYSGLPMLTDIRSAQVYTLSAEKGASIFDIRSSLITKDLEQWAPLINWISGHAT